MFCHFSDVNTMESNTIEYGHGFESHLQPFLLTYPKLIKTYDVLFLFKHSINGLLACALMLACRVM